MKLKNTALVIELKRLELGSGWLQVFKSILSLFPNTLSSLNTAFFFFHSHLGWSNFNRACGKYKHVFVAFVFCRFLYFFLLDTQIILIKFLSLQTPSCPRKGPFYSCQIICVQKGREMVDRWRLLCHLLRLVLVFLLLGPDTAFSLVLTTKKFF